MPPIRQSNRVRKPKVHWEPPPPTRRRRQPAFTIHADPPEDQPTPKDLGTQSPEDLGMEFEDLGMESEDLGMESEDLGMESEDLGMEFEDLDTQFPEDLGMESKDLGMESEDLGMEPEDLDTQPVEDQPYEPQFLSKNRAGKPQNLSEDSNPLKLFQLFFTVKEMKNIVKQTNQ